MRSFKKLSVCAALAASVIGLSACSTMQKGVMSVASLGQASDEDLRKQSGHVLGVDPSRVAISGRHHPAMMQIGWTATLDNGRSYTCGGYYNMGVVGGVNCR